MPIEILMPALSPTMTEGNLAKWLKKEGDKIKAGDVIAEIETDKATMEVEAVDEGTLGKIVVASGTQGVKVNELIGVDPGRGRECRCARRRGRKGGTETCRRSCAVRTCSQAGCRARIGARGSSPSGREGQWP